MTTVTEIYSAPSGTVENLSPHQDACLRQLWLWVTRLCGLRSDAYKVLSGELSPPSSPQQRRQPRRLSKLNKIPSNSDDSTSLNLSEHTRSSSLPSVGIADEDDKYGQCKDFSAALADMSPEQIRQTFWGFVKHENPDALLLRFLRARNWDVRKALAMLVSTLRWRALECDMDNKMINGEALAHDRINSRDPTVRQEAGQFLRQLRMGKAFFHGIDKYNRPICIVRVRLHKPFDQSSKSLNQFIIYIIETSRLLVNPRVENLTLVFDLSDFTISNMDYNPIKFITKCYEANYPEHLGNMIIHKAPWVFFGIWSIIKPWFDQTVAGKIHFTNDVQQLEKFIPRDRIIKELEGGEDWEYHYPEPVPGENDKMKDTATRDTLLAQRQEIIDDLENATLSWAAKGPAPGDYFTTMITERRSELIGKLCNQYWDLDPYIRATSIYDRSGVLQRGGKVNFYQNTSGNSYLYPIQSMNYERYRKREC